MERTEIVAAGKAEAERMHAAVGTMTEGEVKMTVAQFARLAQLIGLLVEAAAPEPGTPGDPRYWVPLSHFARLKARCDALERFASCGALGLAA